MGKKKKTATKTVRVYPSSRQALKRMATEKRVSMAALIEELIAFSRKYPHNR